MYRLCLPFSIQTLTLYFLQFEFLRQLSSDSNKTVIGVVRDKEATEKKVAAELDRSHIHIVEGDIVDYVSIEVCRIAG